MYHEDCEDRFKEEIVPFMKDTNSNYIISDGMRMQLLDEEN